MNTTAMAAFTSFALMSFFFALFKESKTARVLFIVSAIGIVLSALIESIHPGCDEEERLKTWETYDKMASKAKEITKNQDEFKLTMFSLENSRMRLLEECHCPIVERPVKKKS